jgi:hypothetical protein
MGTIYDPRELSGVSTAGPWIGRGVTQTSSLFSLAARLSSKLDLQLEMI